MLIVQPYSMANRSLKAPSFKSEWNEDTIKEKKAEMKEQSQALDKVLADEYVPEKIKKPFKFFKMLYSAALDGISVFGAVLLLKKPVKAGLDSKIVTGVLGKTKVLKDGAGFVGGKLAKGFELLGNALKSTKLGGKVVDSFDKFAQTKVGAGMVKVFDGVGGMFKTAAEKVTKPVKNMTFDKVTNSTAAVLGVGSGAAGAYEAHMEEHPIMTANSKEIEKANVTDEIDYSEEPEDIEDAEIIDEIDYTEVA